MSSAIGSAQVEALNSRLANELGRTCGGTLPRFSWKYAPDQPWYVYDKDDRTVLKKSWADAPAPGGGTIGRAWLLAEWRQIKSEDHCGYGDGVRVAVTKKADYCPYFETTLREGRLPTEELNANYIWALRQQLAMSAEQREDSFEQYMAEEKYTADRNRQHHAVAHLESSRAQYDNYTGAFGNLEPGKRDGWMSFQNVENVLPAAPVANA